MHIANTNSILYFVVGSLALQSLSKRAASRTQAAYRPKTKKAYTRMFKVLLAFCICMKVSIESVNVKVILSLLECLVSNDCTYSMLANYLSAIKASFVLHDLPYHVLDHPKIKLFQKSVRINRPLNLFSRNIIDIQMFEHFTS